MPRYRVNLMVVGNYSVEVEADNAGEAMDQAYESAPSENIYTGFDMGDWLLPSELFPGVNMQDDDVELLE